MTTDQFKAWRLDRDQYVAAALNASAEALHLTVTGDTKAVLSAMSYRYDAVDSVLHQVGAEEFGRMLGQLTDEVCMFLRRQARDLPARQGEQD